MPPLGGAWHCKSLVRPTKRVEVTFLISCCGLEYKNPPRAASSRSTEMGPSCNRERYLFYGKRSFVCRAAFKRSDRRPFLAPWEPQADELSTKQRDATRSHQEPRAVETRTQTRAYERLEDIAARRRCRRENAMQRPATRRQRHRRRRPRRHHARQRKRPRYRSGRNPRPRTRRRSPRHPN